MASSKAQTKTVVPVLADDWGQHHAQMVADAKARADKIKIVFVGDSITARWTTSPGEAIWAQYYAPIGAINLGISADSTQHVLWRLQHGVLDPLHPKMVILMIGTNNTKDEPDAVAYGVWAIVEHIRKVLPDTRVLVQGIFPRSDRADVNEKNQKVNELLAKLDDGKMVKYIYFGDKFLKPDGTLNLDIITDKVHPNNPEGFKIWHAAILPTVEEWLKKDPVPNVPPPPSPVAKPGNLAPATPEPRNDFLSRHNRILATGKAYKDKCELVFMGGETMVCFDRMQGLFKKEYGKYNALNFALWGSRPENMLWQVDNGELDGMQPKLVVLQSQEGMRSATPVEDIAAGTEATAKLILKKIPAAKVLIIGAFPFGEKPNDPLRKRVTDYNALLSKVADGKSVFFLDLGKNFLSPDGTLAKGAAPSQENTTEQAYGAWAEAQRETIQKLIGH
jgi:lysophospholipase L1-like esterase